MTLTGYGCGGMQVLQFGGSIDWTSVCGGCVLPLAEHEAVQACLTWEEAA